MLSKLIILGGGGWFPARGRHTACALLVDGDSAVMIDCGTGVGRLVERPELLAGITKLDIVLTHFHLDHVAGLAYLPAIGLDAEMTVWGPGKLLYGTPTVELVSRLSHEPFHPVPLEDQNIAVRDVPASGLELAGTPIDTRRQERHSAPTLGLRFGDQLTWLTDTAYDPESAPFARGTQILAHECWFTTDAPRTPEVHSSAAQAAEVAAAAGIDRLLLIHLPPFATSLAPLSLEAQAIVPRAVAAEDGADMSVLLAPEPA
jgi:ribonuclease BN (tRNA processing enzyme)